MADFELNGAPSPEEAAAAIAAVEQFLRETAPSGVEADTAARSPWLTAALREGVGLSVDEL